LSKVEVVAVLSTNKRNRAKHAANVGAMNGLIQGGVRVDLDVASLDDGHLKGKRTLEVLHEHRHVIGVARQRRREVVNGVLLQSVDDGLLGLAQRGAVGKQTEACARGVLSKARQVEVALNDPSRVILEVVQNLLVVSKMLHGNVHSIDQRHAGRRRDVHKAAAIVRIQSISHRGKKDGGVVLVVGVLGRHGECANSRVQLDVLALLVFGVQIRRQQSDIVVVRNDMNALVVDPSTVHLGGNAVRGEPVSDHDTTQSANRGCTAAVVPRVVGNIVKDDIKDLVDGDGVAGLVGPVDLVGPAGLGELVGRRHRSVDLDSKS